MSNGLRRRPDRIRGSGAEDKKCAGCRP
jgi:hypothetical protein